MKKPLGFQVYSAGNGINYALQNSFGGNRRKSKDDENDE